MNKAAVTYKAHGITERTGISFNAVLTYFFLETILKKMVYEDVQCNLIFKGGFLLSNVIGVNTRTTVDIDMLIHGLELSEVNVRKIASQICLSGAIPEVVCEIYNLERIRLEDVYGGFRVKILCRLDNIKQIVPLDFATGDPVTPSPYIYNFKCLFYDDIIPLMSYNTETMLAEKLETIIRRSLSNSRSKDFYDIYILWKLYKDSIDLNMLNVAINRTFEYRGTLWNRQSMLLLLDEIISDTNMNTRWMAWQKRNHFAKDINFEKLISEMIKMVKTLN
ncbi:nucleotidyl transferase AbiEii/AbiGii toxin family protein [Acidaminobacter hydrogenoformans]|uniref:Predicted nucleotidyltransferase component of viral defense system n=1 Tax=Acidaminobacter hydrogenoformans DSM 2784 TaxID=1120920 RepID=A0A1G5S3X5_9FIRM|nr:nucleotidyl transferase AbiEii/AbiGii toxin family protein [Acidaminobacter hydrogenoformans]SCZ80239.1 Predicted nucleotidyltransferase component of viral defense system [Acidaminobacter hydrogenoformans DSM 2784]